MIRLSQYLPDSPSEPEVTPFETVSEVGQLADLLGEDSSRAEQVLRLLDGLEDFAEQPTVETAEPLLLPELGTEGFSEVVDQIWETIKRWLAAIARILPSEEETTSVMAGSVLLLANNLKVESRARIANSKRTGSLEIGKQVGALSVHYRPPRDIGQVISNLRVLEKQLSSYYHYVQQVLTGGIPRVIARINALDPLTLSPERLAELTHELERLSPLYLESALGLQKQPSGHRVGPHLIGNYKLVLAPYTAGEQNLRRLGNLGLRIQHSELTPRKLPESFAIPRFPLVTSDQCLDQVVRTAQVLADAFDYNNRKQRVKTIDDLTRAIDGFASKAKRIPNGNPTQKEQAEQVIRLSRTLVDWMTNPYRGLATQALRSLRAALNVCRANA
jgi:hypothetical protein